MLLELYGIAEYGEDNATVPLSAYPQVDLKHLRHAVRFKEWLRWDGRMDSESWKSSNFQGVTVTGEFWQFSHL